MSETGKNTKQTPKENPQVEERGEEKKDVDFITVFKRDSHKDNQCILDGINTERLVDFNSGNPISISNNEAQIIGIKFNEKGEVIRIPYRWLGVQSVN